MVRVEQVLESWMAIREDTAAAVEDLPAGELDFRPLPEVDTFRQIARHILDASEGLVGLLLAGADDFTAPDFRERMKQHISQLSPDAGAAELAHALRESMGRIAAGLRAQGPEFFAGMMTRFDGVRLTRLEMIQTVKEHELTHRSQLFLYLRFKGIVPATTRRRLARQAEE
jgi:uncharacterized damage-inducible protein DinB